MDTGYKTFVVSFFAHNVTLCNTVTFKYLVILEFSRRHGNLKPKRFDFCIEYKPVDRTCSFIITDWNYLVFWKKLALNQVWHF